MANQIDNSWERDTILSLGTKKFKYSIKLTVKQKEEIRKKLFLKKNNKKIRKKDKKQMKEYVSNVVSLIHAYMLHLIILQNKGSLTKIKVCRDTPMISRLNHNYQCIISNRGLIEDFDHINISYGLNKKNNSVQKYGRYVLRGYYNPSYTLTHKDMNNIIELVDTFIK